MVCKGPHTSADRSLNFSFGQTQTSSSFSLNYLRLTLGINNKIIYPGLILSLNGQRRISVLLLSADQSLQYDRIFNYLVIDDLPLKSLRWLITRLWVVFCLLPQRLTGAYLNWSDLEWKIARKFKSLEVGERRGIRSRWKIAWEKKGRERAAIDGDTSILVYLCH